MNDPGKKAKPTSRRKTCIAMLLWLFIPTAAVAVVGPLEQYHRPLNFVLDRYIRREERFQGTRKFIRTRVNYAALKRDPKWPLYIESLARIDKTKIASAPQKDQLAFWINCYNTFVIDAIIQAYPIKSPAVSDFPQTSVQSIPGFWDGPHYVGGMSLSLSEIKARVLQFDDPRALMTLSDGASDSAALPEQRYDPTGLEKQLDDAAFNFCADSMKVRLVHSTSELHLSQIFRREAEFYGKVRTRFTGGSYPLEELAIIGSILPFMTKADREFVMTRFPRVVYEEYDWTLNDLQ